MGECVSEDGKKQSVTAGNVRARKRMMNWDDTRGELTNRTKHAGMSLASGSPARDVSESLESGLISFEPLNLLVSKMPSSVPFSDKVHPKCQFFSSLISCGIPIPMIGFRMMTPHEIAMYCRPKVFPRHPSRIDMEQQCEFLCLQSRFVIFLRDFGILALAGDNLLIAMEDGNRTTS